MKTILLVAAILIISSPLKSQPGFESQQGFEDYHNRNEFLMASPGAMKLGLYGYDNPALLNYVQNPNLMLAWSDEYGAFDRRGLFLGLPSFNNLLPIGFGVLNHSVNDNRITDFKLSTAYGSKAFGVGVSFNLPVRDTDYFNRQNSFTLGTIYRPSEYFSLGLIGTSVTNFDHYEGVIDLAVRPFGNETLTVFADYTLRDDIKVFDGNWSTGVAVEAFPGMHITGRYFNNNAFTAGIEFSLGNISFSTQGGFNDFKYNHNTYAVRVGPYESNLPNTKFRNPENFASLELNKPMRYQRYLHFDDSNTLKEKLDVIEGIAEHARIGGVVINTSGMNINHTKLWELREQLKKVKEQNKKVVIFIDNADMNTYHFASVADIVIMHPLGSVDLPGYLMGNIYLGNMLEEMGVGVKEFKFHEYKSGFESFARDGMSDEAREQQQRLVDNIYNFVKKDITESRDFTDEKYEKLVNEIFHFNAEKAHEHGLVDKLGRWDDMNDIIDNITEAEKTILEDDRLERFLERTVDYKWGEKPKIAVVYAEGFCDMETGMQARSLSKEIKDAREDDGIKAIVLRVESPGGSILALDIISEELRKAKKEKPLVISQGSVAASGGYWLSMYGDEIVTAPNTMTGSIGVISGWLYDDGLKEKIGYNTDYVKKGEYADLGFGIPVPILNLPLLDEKFTDKEEEVIKDMLSNTYENFISKIANTRDKEYEDVDSVARGRVWSGKDAIDVGLADTIGGLDKAIKIAAEKAEIDIDKGYTIVEYPKPELFSATGFLTYIIFQILDIESPEEAEDPIAQYLKFLNKHHAKPLPILPLEYMNHYFYKNPHLE